VTVTTAPDAKTGDKRTYTLHIDRSRLLFETLSGDIAFKYDIGTDTRIRAVDGPPAHHLWCLEGKGRADDSGHAAKQTFHGACDSGRSRDVLVHLIRHLCEEVEESADVVTVSIALADHNSQRTHTRTGAQAHRRAHAAAARSAAFPLSLVVLSRCWCVCASVALAANDVRLQKELLSAQQETATVRSELTSTRKRLKAAESERDTASERLKALTEAKRQSDSAYDVKLAGLLADKQAQGSGEAKNAAALKELEIERNNARDDIEALKKTLRSMTEQLATATQRDVRTRTCLKSADRLTPTLPASSVCCRMPPNSQRRL
jgi:chromosome segregation ATPase